MRPLLLRLKGFIGIKNGLGLDEVTVDVSSLTGLIALVGTNGAGKTTFMDNLHPYRLMPSKTNGVYTPGSFSFYNETSGLAEKELIFEMGGEKYRSILLIDQDRGKQEAYLYIQKDGEWKVLNKDGRVSTFDKAVEALVGSPRLYFNSIFRCQEAPRLNTYRKGVIKDILAELLLLSDIQEKGKAAKAVVDLLTQIIDQLRTRESVLDPEARKVNEVETQLATAEGILKQAVEDLKKAETAEAEAISAQNVIEVDLAKFKLLEDSRAKTAEQADKLQRQSELLCKKREELEGRHYDKYKAFLEKRIRVRKIVSHAKSIRSKVDEENQINTRLTAIETELADMLVKIEEAGKFAKEAARLSIEMNPFLVKQGQNKTLHQGKITSLEAEIPRIESSVKRLHGLPCGEDVQRACPAVKATVMDKNRLADCKNDLVELKKGTGEDPVLAAKISDLSDKMDELQRKSDSKVYEKKKNELKEDKDKLKKQLVEVAKWTRLLPELESAQESLRELVAERDAALQEHLSDLDSLTTEEDTVVDEFKGVKKTLDEIDVQLLSAKDLEVNKVGASQVLGQARKEVETNRVTHIDAVGKAASLKEWLSSVRKAAEKLAVVRARLHEAQAECNLWSTVEKAFSNDGIIALEIDDSGPYIGSLANQLLSTCFGPQFSVRIDTQDMRADGTQAESFDITVIDNETGMASSLHDKSGGQKTWIEDAITKAIALFNAERSRRKYHTLFTDERDGALAQDAKRDFFLLKREALKLGGFMSEFFISHTPEAQDMADHRLVFQRGEGVTVE